MLSLYVHIPFCGRKCSYCGFYSTTYTTQSADEYLAALHLECVRYQRAFKNRTFDSVYIGGGTPTVLSPEQLMRLIHILREHFQISHDAEFTLEANPNSVSNDCSTLLREYGINRLSLGIQSFDDKVLSFLGRLHSASAAVNAFQVARRAGFSNIGIDLIYGVPGQTEDQWNETLDKAIVLRPEHISAYSLSLDKGSRFMKAAKAGNFALPGDEQVAAMQELTVEILGRAGYGRYEISNYCLPGFICRHNMNYWQRGEYLGLGPSAWSFIEGKRYHTVADARIYSERMTAGLPVKEDEETVGIRQAANEKIMLGLRTVQGVDLVGFGREFGADALEQLDKNAALLIQAGVLDRATGRIRLTRRGFLLADEALARLAL